MSQAIDLEAGVAFPATAKLLTRPSVSVERPPKPAPFSLRLSTAERERLLQEAGDLSLGAYIRERLFGNSLPKRRPHIRKPVKDQQALAQALGLLGNSHLANNLNQLAKAGNSGLLGATPETVEALQKAADDVCAMREMLMRALGQIS